MKKVYEKLIFVLLFCATFIVVSYGAVIYDNDIRSMTGDKNLDETKRIYSNMKNRDKKEPEVKIQINKPIAEETIDPNSISYSEKKKKYEYRIFPSFTTIDTYQPEATQTYDTNQEFTYIRHRKSVTIVTGDYSWEEDYTDEKRRTKLLFYYSIGSNEGPPKYAVSGFYKIGDKTYCFDKDGHLIKGMAKDEMDIVYIFDENTGELLNTYQE